MFVFTAVERIVFGKPAAQALAAEVDRLDKIARKYERGDIAKVDWLDGLVFQEIENIKQVRPEVWSEHLELLFPLQISNNDQIPHFDKY